MASTLQAGTVDTRDTLAGILEETYGSECENQFRRYDDALTCFRERYGEGPVALFRAPGRINLVGGHTDYNHGYVLPVALDRDLLVVARPRTDNRVRLTNIEPEFDDDEFAIGEVIPRSDAITWTNYVRGAAQMVAKLAPGSAVGMDCLVVGRAPQGIPRGSGLSSSSALTVAAALSLAHFAGVEIERQSFAQLCSDAEWYVGTRGGIMDQFISLFARRNHALFLDCRPDANGVFATELVTLPEEYEIIVAESGIRHNNVRGEYNKRVASCRAGVGLLHGQWPHASHLRDLEAIDWAQIESLLPPELSVSDCLANGCDIGDVPGLQADDVLRVQACCRHVWHENHRVREVFDALRAGDVMEAGRLISLAHASLRDEYQTSFAEMETLVRAASQVPGVAGGRLTGAGWGGCAVFLVRREYAPVLQEALERAFQEQHGSSPGVFPCRTGTAAGYLATVTI